MADFQLYLTDQRYAAPTLLRLEAETDVLAIEIAADVFSQGRGHHTGAELWREGSLIASTGAPHARPSQA